ncbi:uncharacterized protein LOC135218726 [Macrobrachium nipponense]|uniref:uncharacterized protein LOC135218726 n=1 Tax=Macrobrachium nipponense TaxID=159736 RepID=UPI0030C86730
MTCQVIATIFVTIVLGSFMVAQEPKILMLGALNNPMNCKLWHIDEAQEMFRNRRGDSFYTNGSWAGGGGGGGGEWVSTGGFWGIGGGWGYSGGGFVGGGGYVGGFDGGGGYVGGGGFDGGGGGGGGCDGGGGGGGGG